MKKIETHEKSIFLDSFIPIAIAIVFLSLIVGCTGKFGSLKRDAEVQQAFESIRVPMEYKYYHFGDSEPYVIFGIDPKFTLDSKMWRDVSPDTDEFKEMIRFIWEDYGYYKFGANILDPDGNKVGIMYTAIRATSVKFVGDNRVVVMPNKPFLWGPDAGSGSGTRAR
jgi:hypothetical protein